MIDVENHVFDYVYPYAAEVLPENCFRSEYVPEPAKFPFATLIEIDNITDTRHRTSADEEEYAVVTYELNAYALTKKECRTVANAIDTAMVRLNFTRVSMSFIPNLADTAIYRINARYTGAADRNNVIYRRV